MKKLTDTELRERMLSRKKKLRFPIQPLLVLILIVVIFTFLINIVSASTDVSIKESPVSIKNNIETKIQGEVTVEKELEKKVEVTKPEPVPVPIETSEPVVEVKKIETVVEPKVVEKIVETPVYLKDLPLPVEHQKFLYERCMELGLDYEKALAVMEHESKFDSNAVGATKDYGYFQINVINHKWMADMNDTANRPLDPKTNILWGTYMLSDLYNYWEAKGKQGEALDEAVWSSYNKGTQGYKNTGVASEYVSKVKESLVLVKEK